MVEATEELRGVDRVLNRISSIERTDAVIPVRASTVRMVGSGDPVVPMIQTGTMTTVPTLSNQLYRATEWAHRQIAKSAKIPWSYYDKMLSDENAVGLLNVNVNHWWHRPGHPGRLARFARNDDGMKLRAWLSPRYRVLDNEDLVANVLREAEKITDVQIRDASVDDERMYVRLITPITGEIETGDVCQLGLTLRNSEVGDGSVQVAPYILRLVCSNGMVAPVRLRQVHLGYRRQEGIVSRQTIELDSQAIWSGIRDWIRFVLDSNRLDEVLSYFQKAKEQRIETEARVAVGNVVRSHKLKTGEAQAIFERYLRNNDDSRFGLVNAVTQAAHEAPTLSMRRQVKLEKVGGELLTQADRSFSSMVHRSLSSKEASKLFGN